MKGAPDFRPILAAIETGLHTRGHAAYLIESLITPYRAGDIAAVPAERAGAEVVYTPTPRRRHKHTQFILTDNEFRSPVIRGRVLSMLQQVVKGPVLRWRLERWHNAEDTSSKPDGTGFAVGMHWTLALTYADDNGGCGCGMPLATAEAT